MPARRSSRFIYPRSPLRRDFTKENAAGKAKPKTKPSEGDCNAIPEGLFADAFFGASPVVASALDLRQGRDPPADQVQFNTHPFVLGSKGDILTLHEKGTFLLCADRPNSLVSRQSRKFLFPAK